MRRLSIRSPKRTRSARRHLARLAKSLEPQRARYRKLALAGRIDRSKSLTNPLDSPSPMRVMPPFPFDEFPKSFLCRIELRRLAPLEAFCRTRVRSTYSTSPATERIGKKSMAILAIFEYRTAHRTPLTVPLDYRQDRNATSRLWPMIEMTF